MPTDSCNPDGRWRAWADRACAIACLVAVEWYLLSLLPPSLVLRDDVLAGGDTPSHFYLAKIAAAHLFPSGRLTGWEPGNFCGYPTFFAYFPFAFVLIWLLSALVEANIAVRLVTVAGPLLLPLAMYAGCRVLRLTRRGACVAAALTVMFLTSEYQTMWGGNLSSMLAGEFAFSLSLAMVVFGVCLLSRGMATGRHFAANVLLTAAIGFCHGTSFIWAFLAALGTCCDREAWRTKLTYLLAVYTVAVGVLSFWLLPGLLYGGYSSTYKDIWHIRSVFGYMPRSFYWLAALALGGAAAVDVWRRDTRRFAVRPIMLVTWALAAWVPYRLAFFLNVADIRFLPFLPLAIVFLAALVLDALLPDRAVAWLAAAGAVLLSLAIGDGQLEHTPDWVAWNYGGLRAKEYWPHVETVCDRLRGDFAEPRAAYEHSMRHNAAGATRIFELLPMFAGRATLEGLYMQSSISAPFVFNLQSEYSRRSSRPLPQFRYNEFDLDLAAAHLALFNVGDFIAIEPETIEALDRHPAYVPAGRVGPYALYGVGTNSGRYATHLDVLPVVSSRRNWKQRSQLWLRHFTGTQPHVVFADALAEEDRAALGAAVQGDILDAPAVRSAVPKHQLSEEIGREEIVVRGAVPNQPLLLKVSYSPHWRVEGARAIYLVSPCFMLVIPQTDTVRFRFGPTALDRVGAGLTVAACLALVGIGIGTVVVRRRRAADREVH